MDPETKAEFEHGRKNFKELHDKIDKQNQTMASHILEDSQNFGTLINRMDLLTLGVKNHDKESEQRVRTERARITDHLGAHDKTRALLIKVVLTIAIPGLLAFGATVWNAFQAAANAERVLMEMKKQNGNHEP